MGSLLADQQDKQSGSYQHRLSVRLFDPASFCAAPRPNQKRSLSIVVSAVIGSALGEPHYAYGGYGVYLYSVNAKSRNPGQGCFARRHHER
jgi:hypothetical protein